jgi:putative serine protease PepD
MANDTPDPGAERRDPAAGSTAEWLRHERLRGSGAAPGPGAEGADTRAGWTVPDPWRQSGPPAGTVGGPAWGGSGQPQAAYPSARPGGPPGVPGAYPGPDRPRRGGGRAALVGFALVTALLGGGIGGAVGYSMASGNSGGSSGVLAQPVPDVDAAATPLSPVEAVAARVLPSVVQLRVAGPGTSGEGSGMILSGDGLLLTNNHVIEAAANGGRVVAVFQDGSTAQARIVGRDPSSDLAVLRAQNVTGLTPIELGNSDAVRVGQQVVAFGSPLGLGGTVTTGIISALDRAVSVGRDSGASEATVLNALQTDAAINPGNSGGPLVDMEGRVVGINSAIATTGAQSGSIGVGFSIPVNQARRIADELERDGRATRAVLGVSLNPGRDPERPGALIGEVTPGGPADGAGLRAGEVVTRVGDRVITDGNELVAAIRDRVPGEEVTLTVDGREVTVTLGSQTG